jgi:predicted ATPase/uncharacterized protein HemY
LPPQLTPFVGREEELAQISTYLTEPGCRLLTLVGPGGIGKSRLAVQAAEQLGPPGTFLQGVCFVPLASVAGPQFLVAAIAEAVGLSLLGQEDPKTQLLNFLRDRHTLLILENFEHLLTDVELLVDILTVAQAVKLLVTSRERLNLQQEWLLEVQGLRFPETERPEMDSPETYSAVQLFMQSANRVRKTFNLTQANAPHIVRICQLLEGMPLGIELAASWIPVLSCWQIVRELEKGLDGLTTSWRDMPPRHRSMRAVIEHSWQLLSNQERQVFRQMAVFRGGFRKDAVERVVGASLDTLSALVHKSFLRRIRGGRYHLHELFRQFAAEKLAEWPAEKQAVQGQHCRYYLTFLQKREKALIGPGQQEVLVEIKAEIENVREAWSWAIDQLRLEEIERSVEGIFRFYVRQSWYQEGYNAFQRLVESLEDLQEPEQLLLAGKVLARQAVCCSHRFDLKQAQELLEQSLATLHQVGPIARNEIAFALMHLGDVAFDLGAYSEAQQRLEESLAIHRETDDHWGMAFSLAVLSYLAYTRGHYPEAKHQAQESLAIFSEIGDQWGIAYAQNAVGLVAYLMGDYAEAKHHLQTCLNVTRDLKDRFISLFALTNLGRIALALGDYDEAKLLFRKEHSISKGLGLKRGFFTLSRLSQLARIQKKYQEARQRGSESLALAREAGNCRGISSALNNLGCLACLQGEYGQAEQWLQESLALRQELGYCRGVAESLSNLGKVALARDSLREAEEHFRQALQIAVDIQAKAIALDILIGIAGLLVKETAVERAVALLTLALDHPSSEQESKGRARELLTDLELEFPVLVAAAARTGGSPRALEEVATEILDWQELVVDEQ